MTEILRQRVFNQAQEARAQAKQIAMDSNSKEYRYCDGLGELKMRVPTMSKVYWSNREGQECWNDKQFLHEFEKQNEEVRINSKGKHNMIVSPGKPYDPDSKYLVNTAA